jgi:hypothetical protein
LVVAILDILLDELDFVHDVFIEVFHMHLHADDLGQTELSS